MFFPSEDSIRTMSVRRDILIISLCLITNSAALKCRTGEESQPSEDFEYVVRMCLRQMKNASRHENFDRNFQNLFQSDRNRNWMQNMEKGYNSRNQGDGDGFEHFWNSNAGREKEQEQKGDGDRGKIGNDYMEDSDYFHVNPFRGVSNENRPRVRRPHTYQQQMQHDRDINYGYGHRDGPYNYQNADRNKSSKRTSNREKKGDSPLEQLDPCMVHCIFQEMQMLDENGKPDKNTVSEKMSQKIRNPELKSFIQDSVEECFDAIEEESDNNRVKGPDFMCVWSKNFAICLEDKGKESCDDWNEPLHRNKNRDEQKNKNKNAKGGGNRG